MNESYHREITRAALSLTATKLLAQVLSEKSVIGDRGEANSQSASHFDNCCWYEGVRWIEEHRQKAVDASIKYFSSGNETDFNSVCENLGYLIHTTEDFYSHSNWVENNEWGVIADFNTPKPIGWYSGYYENSKPHKATAGVPSHDRMNKDTSSKPNFYKAYCAAVIAVKEQIKKFQDKIRERDPQNADGIISKLGFRNAPKSFIDSALYWPNNKVYFFKENKYFRYCMTADKADDGYPKIIKNYWHGMAPFANRIDGAFVKPDGSKAYFFSGDKYIRYDVKNDKADDGYPLPIKNNWKGLDAFSEGIDAVFIIPCSNSVYFFKGDSYIVYDISKNKALDGYPRKIIGSWKGLEGFGSIDAAFSIIDIQGNIKIYFFKGDQYVRYHYLGDISLTSVPDWDITYSQVRRDMLASDSMDSGYPLYISENWHGLVNV